MRNLSNIIIIDFLEISRSPVFIWNNISETKVQSPKRLKKQDEECNVHEVNDYTIIFVLL
jgi:hypothetical protein